MKEKTVRNLVTFFSKGVYFSKFNNESSPNGPLVYIPLDTLATECDFLRQQIQQNYLAHFAFE